jgi:hypothetical protein
VYGVLDNYSQCESITFEPITAGAATGAASAVERGPALATSALDWIVTERPGVVSDSRPAHIHPLSRPFKKLASAGGGAAGAGAAVAAAAEAASSRQQTVESITTTTQTSSSYHGLFFDVTARSSQAIWVDGVVCGSEGKGASVGTLYVSDRKSRDVTIDRSAWIVCTDRVTLSDARPTLTKLPTPIRIEAGQSKGFYLHCTAHNEAVAYVRDSALDWKGSVEFFEVGSGRYTKDSARSAMLQTRTDS